MRLWRETWQYYNGKPIWLCDDRIAWYDTVSAKYFCAAKLFGNISFDGGTLEAGDYLYKGNPFYYNSNWVMWYNSSASETQITKWLGYGNREVVIPAYDPDESNQPYTPPCVPGNGNTATEASYGGDDWYSYQGEVTTPGDYVFSPRGNLKNSPENTKTATFNAPDNFAKNISGGGLPGKYKNSDDEIELIIGLEKYKDQNNVEYIQSLKPTGVDGNDKPVYTYGKIYYSEDDNVWYIGSKDIDNEYWVSSDGPDPGTARTFAAWFRETEEDDYERKSADDLTITFSSYIIGDNRSQALFGDVSRWY